ncbi:MAG: ABC-three component system protein [Janthinobacterium lividum]
MSVEGPTPVVAAGCKRVTGAAAIDIVFVHGLSGDRRNTWTAPEGGFWPEWLVDDFSWINVFLAGYDSNAFASFLLGDGASIQDIASTLADGLISRPHQADSIILVTHSLGGLIVKQMLRRCKDSADPRFKALLAQIKAVVFLGTPHKGAGFTAALDLLLHPFKSKFTKQLVYNNDTLTDLNNFFCNFVVEQKITVRTYYETEKTRGVHIVNRVTADPGVYGTELIAVQADHVAICKPTSKNALVYRSICELLRSFAPPEAGKGLIQMPGAQLPVALVNPSLPEDMAPQGISPDILYEYMCFTTVAKDDRRDVRQKLNDAGRSYQIEEAQKCKERFTMTLRRHIAQPTAVTRYTRLLSDVRSRFTRHVGFAISSGYSQTQVDEVLQNKVIDSCVERFSATGDEMTASLVDNALYYLVGNCHLSWNNE